jgi:hypothetical protein
MSDQFHEPVTSSPQNNPRAHEYKDGPIPESVWTYENEKIISHYVNIRPYLHEGRYDAEECI